MLSTSVLSPIAFQAVRASPRLVSSVQAVAHPMPPTLQVQRRNLGIVDIVVRTAVDGTFLATGLAGLRRMTGIDFRDNLDRISEPTRRYLYNYLDYGELCLDWLLRLCFIHPAHSYQTYKERYGDSYKHQNRDKQHEIESKENQDDQHRS